MKTTRTTTAVYSESIDNARVKVLLDRNVDPNDDKAFLRLMTSEGIAPPSGFGRYLTRRDVEALLDLFSKVLIDWPHEDSQPLCTDGNTGC